MQSGFALLKNRRQGKERLKLMRMMGTHATASCGAVIAHHQAPLTAVRRELALAEKRAKNKGGRDAFSLTVVKRSGGALYLTEKWGEPVNLLVALREFLLRDGVSRRAVYHTLEWLDARELPVDASESGMLGAMLAYQLDRQAQGDAKSLAPDLAKRLSGMTGGWDAKHRIAKLRNFLSVAEFLARETRNAGDDA